MYKNRPSIKNAITAYRKRLMNRKAKASQNENIHSIEVLHSNSGSGGLATENLGFLL
jgi:hypothetical protein